MSSSDRGERDKGVGWPLTFVGLILVLGIAWGIGYLQARESERRQQTSSNYRKGAKSDAQAACIGTEPRAVFECVYERAEASKEQANTQQDLSAQQRAASSGLASAAISVLTFIATVVGVWFVKRTLDATLHAVEDTSFATDAMWHANRIAMDAQRAWLSLRIEPQVIRDYGGNGLYFRINFITANVGSSAATQFEIKYAVLFERAGESGHEMAVRMQHQVNDWFEKRNRTSALTIPPHDSATNPWWDGSQPPAFEWSKIINEVEGVTPYFLVAAFYRTMSHPEICQVVWRAWMIHSIDDKGQTLSFVERHKTHTKDQLCADPFTNAAHHYERPAAP